jgi:hypothetical protein
MQLLARWGFCLAAVTASAVAIRAETAPQSKAPVVKSENSAPKPRNSTDVRRFESTITAIEVADGLTKITLQNGAMIIGLKPTTTVLREERGLGASDLQVGDTLSLVTLRGARSKINIKENAGVTSANPLVLKIGEFASMTLNKADAWEFNRSTKLDEAALAVGQTVAVEIGLQRDGEISTNRVAIVVAKPKAPRVKSSRARRPRVRKAAPMLIPVPENRGATPQNSGA